MLYDLISSTSFYEMIGTLLFCEFDVADAGSGVSAMMGNMLALCGGMNSHAPSVIGYA